MAPTCESTMSRGTDATLFDVLRRFPLPEISSCDLDLVTDDHCLNSTHNESDEVGELLRDCWGMLHTADDSSHRPPMTPLTKGWEESIPSSSTLASIAQECSFEPVMDAIDFSAESDVLQRRREPPGLEGLVVLGQKSQRQKIGSNKVERILAPDTQAIRSSMADRNLTPRGYRATDHCSGVSQEFMHPLHLGTWKNDLAYTSLASEYEQAMKKQSSEGSASTADTPDYLAEGSIATPTPRKVPRARAATPPPPSLPPQAPTIEWLAKTPDQQGDATSPITTLMMYDIPFGLTLLEVVDVMNSLGFAGTYDFVYMPPSKGRSRNESNNIGYAFMNFKRPDFADAFLSTFQNYQFPNQDSAKLTCTKPAHCQGYQANAEKHARHASTGYFLVF